MTNCGTCDWARHHGGSDTVSAFVVCGLHSSRILAGSHQPLSATGRITDYQDLFPVLKQADGQPVKAIETGWGILGRRPNDLEAKRELNAHCLTNNCVLTHPDQFCYEYRLRN